MSRLYSKVPVKAGRHGAVGSPALSTPRRLSKISPAGGKVAGSGGQKAKRCEEEEEELFLFSSNRRSSPVFGSGDEEEPGCSNGSLDRPMLDALDFPQTLIDDLTSMNIGEHDYDWLMALPESPRSSPPSAHSEIASIKTPSTARMSSKTSKIPVTQAKNSKPAIPARNISLQQPSRSSKYLSHVTNSSRSATTSKSNVSTLGRPVTPRATSTPTRQPTRRSSTAMSVSSKQSGSLSHLAASRPPTPSTSAQTNRLSQATRPSTAPLCPRTSASRSMSSLKLPARRPSSYSSRWGPVLVPSPNSSSSATSSKSMTTTDSGSIRPSSLPTTPSQNRKATAQSRLPLEFSIDTPPNSNLNRRLTQKFSVDTPSNSDLQKRLTQIQASTGRTQESVAYHVNSNELQPLTNLSKQQSSLLARTPENFLPKFHTHGNVLLTASPEMQKSRILKFTSKKIIETASLSTGSEITVSEKSPDIAPRHLSMEDDSIACPFCGSLQSASTSANSNKIMPTSDPSKIGGNESDEYYTTSSGSWSNNNCSDSESDEQNISSDNGELLMGISLDRDNFDSLRYDAIFLGEDPQSMNWLHNFDDSCEQMRLSLDPSFGFLPEPFLSNYLDSESGEQNVSSDSGDLLMGISLDRVKFDSLRYDAIFLGEDPKSMNWLHSIDCCCEQMRLSLDPLFQMLPEPLLIVG